MFTLYPLRTHLSLKFGTKMGPTKRGTRKWEWVCLWALFFIRADANEHRRTVWVTALELLLCLTAALPPPYLSLSKKS